MRTIFGLSVLVGILLFGLVAGVRTEWQIQLQTAEIQAQGFRDFGIGIGVGLAELGAGIRDAGSRAALEFQYKIFCQEKAAAEKALREQRQSGLRAETSGKELGLDG